MVNTEYDIHVLISSESKSFWMKTPIFIQLKSSRMKSTAIPFRFRLILLKLSIRRENPEAALFEVHSALQFLFHVTFVGQRLSPNINGISSEIFSDDESTIFGESDFFDGIQFTR